MATALGAAMAMPPAGMLLVFAALGVGMALPYGLLGLFPGLAGVLPRPGVWMERLKQGLAFPMYATAAWLLWVLAQLAGADGVAIALAGAVAIGFAAWVFGATQYGGRVWLGRGIAAVAVLAAALLLPRLASAPAPATEAARDAWSPARVEALRAAGRPVFVNLTAAWCISCKVNERVALDTAAVRDAFVRGNVAVLIGDWTRGDRAITALLREHERAGVPLYLFYPAGGGAPAVLPQILTEGIMLRAIDEATTS
jgi:thiol:disulfide interchange protein DsbD